jgi:hypothetical protein
MKRWFGIRHVRYLYHAMCFWHWWDNVGRFLGAVPNPDDLQFLRDVLDGKA